MSGHGPAPKADSRTRHVPIRGEWQATPGVGWQFGAIPPCPVRRNASRVAWATWFRAWFAAHWTPDDVPGLRQVIRLYDQVEAGEFVRATELRLAMDNYGITPKGQQDRRWARPKPETVTTAPVAEPAGPYAGLRVVNA
jgi:hypothetical protein